MHDLKSHIKPERPEPVELEQEPFSVNKESKSQVISRLLLSGEYGMVEDIYPTGLKALSALKKAVFGKNTKDDFIAYREKRTEFYEASNRLLASVENNEIALRKSPDIGWLKKLYPDLENFVLSFPQIQGLNSAWQWYINGIQYPVLNQKIHPYYGTYFPTRFDHLNLFDDWLKKYTGDKNSALDIGTGCGILSFQLLNRGFYKVYATDISPNAIISVAENAKKFGVEERLVVIKSDLFENVDQKTDVIVFNPPWLPAQKSIRGLDKAIYYEAELFERFFREAGNFLLESGRIILLFSNLGEHTGIQKIHPIEDELTKNKRYKKLAFKRKKVARPSRKTKRRDNRKNEFVELWELGV